METHSVRCLGSEGSPGLGTGGLGPDLNVDPGEMDAARWLAHFRANRQDRPEPDWDAPVTLAPAAIARLVRSLEQFHLGDGGGPASLIAWNCESFRGSSESTRELVDLWFAEEKEHSRLLSGAVGRFGGTPIAGHWSFTVFCWVRRWSGVRAELAILLLTEIVSTIYYRLMRRYGEDPALRAMCRLILRDEAGHVAFHRDRMARQAAGRGMYWGLLWETRFRILGLAAGTMLWINHARAIEALSGQGLIRMTREFYRGAWKELSVFVARLRRDSARAPAPALRLPAVRVEPA